MNTRLRIALALALSVCALNAWAAIRFTRRFPFVSFNTLLRISPNVSQVCGVNPLSGGMTLQFTSNLPKTQFATPGPGTITQYGLYSAPAVVASRTSVQITAHYKNQTVFSTVTLLTPLVITTTSLPDAVVGQPYSAQLQATGGCTP